jgi:hypothetical protein
MFTLAGKVVPLPIGKFTLAAAWEQGTRNQPSGNMLTTPSNIAEVVLVQTEGRNLRAVIWARANVDTARTRWTDEPCKRNDMLFKLDRTKSFNYFQDCVTVNHRVGFLRNPDARWAPVHEMLTSQGVVLPVAIVMDASLTRIEQFQYLAVSYWINPAAFGFASDAALNWSTSSWHKSRIEKDSQKLAFAKALRDWAVELEPVIDQGFRGKAIPASVIPPLRLPTF